MLYLNTKRTRIDAGLSGIDVLHAGCMHAAYVGLYDVVVDAGQSGALTTDCPELTRVCI